MDNIKIERFWRTVKYEEIHPKEYDSVWKLKRTLNTYFDFYSNELSHGRLGGKSPADVYFEGLALKQAAGW